MQRKGLIKKQCITSIKVGILWREKSERPPNNSIKSVMLHLCDNYQKEGVNSEERRGGKIVNTYPGANEIQPTA